MASDPLRRADLARWGLGTDQALRALEEIGLWTDDAPTASGAAVIPQIAASPHPEQALRTLEQLAARHPGNWNLVLRGADGGSTEGAVQDVAAMAPEQASVGEFPEPTSLTDHLVGRVVLVAGASKALGELLVGSEDAFESLADRLDPWSVDDVRHRAAAALTSGGGSPAHRLCHVQRQGLLRIAARDLLELADTPAASAELADLAQGVLAAALDHVTAGRDDVRIAVIGMGKLGGRELNYVSDVDVMFVGEGDWSVCARVAERFLRVLGEMTPQGRTYDIDTNLRPEGRDGPLVRTLDAYRQYYERWARTWEFQALLKARPVAGDPALGKGFTDLAERFVWPDRLEAAAVAEIQGMKGQVERSEAVQRHGGRQVKLGPGGLRDIEFAVQLLQLVHGRHDPLLRSSNTLEALSALAEGGYVDPEDAALFSDAYQFLRTVEHRLQLGRLRRTHTIPAGDDDRYRLARTVGFGDTRSASALEQFDRELGRVQGYVRRLHEKLFYRPLLERFAELGAAEQLTRHDGRLDEEAARERLAALGFADPRGALTHLDALASGVTRRARLFRTLLPAILPTLADAPDPDGGLAAFRGLADRLGESPQFLRTLSDNPPVGELLARVLGSGRIVGEWLKRQPEVFSQLADLAGLGRSLGPDDYERLAGGLLRRARDPDRASAALRKLKRREVARIAVRDLGGFATVGDVGEELSGVAAACLDAAIGLVTPKGVRMAVIGLGKLGGKELGYASDLDVLLVFEPARARDRGLQAAEEVTALLSEITPEGQAFRVDLGLRPEGKDGALARTLDSYRSYYERWAEDWEFQALTLARPVAGDRELGAAFCELITPFVYPEQVPAERLQAVRRMKARVERERAGGGRRAPTVRRPRRAGPAPRPPGRPPEPANLATAADRMDVKLGPGGLSDIEWTVQLLQLRHGGLVPSVRQPGTLRALGALEEADLIGGQDALWLREGLTFLSRVRNVLYLMGERDTSVVPASSERRNRLAQVLGYPTPAAQALGEELGRVTRRVRKVHERLFYE